MQHQRGTPIDGRPQPVGLPTRAGRPGLKSLVRVGVIPLAPGNASSFRSWHLVALGYL